MKTPKIVVRMIPGFYSTTSVKFTKKPIPENDISPFKVHYTEPVRDKHGRITQECRKAIESRALRFAKINGLRVCVVFASDDSRYIEPNGEVKSSDDPPQMKMNLADGNKKIEFDLFDQQHPARKRFVIKRKRGLNGAIRSFSMLFLLLAASLLFAACPAEPSLAGPGTQNLPASKSQSRCIDVRDAADHLGPDVCVTGKVASVSYRPDVKGRPTFVNLGADYPDQALTVLVWGENRKELAVFLDDIEGKELTVTGTVRVYRGTPEIIVRREEQLNVIPTPGQRSTNPKKKKKNDDYARATIDLPTARCRDGWISHSRSRRGTCSHHGGVQEWLRNL